MICANILLKEDAEDESKENDENLEEDKEKLVQTLYNPRAFFAFMNLFYNMCKHKKNT